MERARCSAGHRLLGDRVVKPSDSLRFWPRVDKDGPVHPTLGTACWLWTACLAGGGYGQVWVDGRLRYAHIVAYAEVNGDVPPGLELDHLCRNRACCNPAHLEAVTRQINQLRGMTLAAKNAAKTECPKGHPYSGDNLKVYGPRRRSCAACNRERARINRLRRKAS